jgi:hypothetical protein
MTTDKLKESIKTLEEKLDKALPDNYEEWETHEDLADGYERAWDRTDTVARNAIKLLKECAEAIIEQEEK